MSLLGGLLGGAAKLVGGALGITQQPKISVQMPSMPSVPIIGGGAGISVGKYNFGIGGEVGKRTTQSYYGEITTSPSTAAGQGGSCPRGFHLNKHALPASKRHGAVPARTICVRNRHVNALNGRAAGRALRRLKRADKMTRKIHSLFHRPARKTGKFGRK